jgi:ABC-type Fe3+ transport system permease subunit
MSWRQLGRHLFGTPLRSLITVALLIVLIVVFRYPLALLIRHLIIDVERLIQLLFLLAIAVIALCAAVGYKPKFLRHKKIP